jgi:hypothetical protein
MDFLLGGSVDTAQLWWSAEQRGVDMGWRFIEVNRNRMLLVPFDGDDPFYLVTRVQGVDYHAGKKNLRQMLANDPNATLELGGEFANMVQTLVVWNPFTHQFEPQPFIVQRRIAVLIDVISNGQRKTIRAVPQ